MPHEVLEKRKLLRRQFDALVASSHRVRCRVEREITGGKHRWPLPARAAHERPQARQELVEREGFREVVVGPGVEPAHAVVDGIARGEHEDGRPSAGLADPTARLEPVDPGQHHVEDDRVVVVLRRHPRAVLTRRNHVHRVALFLQPAPDQLRHPLMVLDDQHAHALTSDRRS